MPLHGRGRGFDSFRAYCKRLFLSRTLKPGPMTMIRRLACTLALPMPLLLALLLGGCETTPAADASKATTAAESEQYIIGAGDKLNVFVYDNPQLSVGIPVRPDGRISTPLVSDSDAKVRDALAPIFAASMMMVRSSGERSSLTSGDMTIPRDS